MFNGLLGTGNQLHPSWRELKELSDLDLIIKNSNQKKQVIFKHSTRCSISSMAFSRLKNEWDQVTQDVDFYYLDLIQYRNISNTIAEKLGVVHQSPQVIILDKAKVVNHASHNQVGVGLINAI
jgi:bacillithiol system protein YtxJ